MEALNLTRDEVNRLSEALKDETFRQLLGDYAAEISNLDNKRQYEEDIKQLEADRGMHVKFIHPEAHHVLKTSIAGGKCFINVCSDPLIDKPSCEAARDRDGKAGQNWTLPFSLTPGRPDKDAKGTACVIYDVVFHPDALHMAVTNARFMRLINSTAIKGIEDSFQVKLETSKIKLLKSKYKGVPHPAVIRKPIPGYVKQMQSPCAEDLSFPYPEPDVQSPACPDETKSSFSIQHIEPHYTLKYRSVIDLQNYRYSRDSVTGVRPKDIIIIINLPLLASARDVDVNVTERLFILKAQKPSYKLELLLSYPVDEDKGDAKFNKTTKQLTITLPVLPEQSTKLPQIKCDDDDEEEKRESEGKAGLLAHQDKEKLCETQHTDLNCDILTQSTSDRCGQINVALESLCLSNSCDVGETETPLKTEETNYFPNTCVAEISLDDQEIDSDMNINPHEMFVSEDSVRAAKEFERKPTTTFQATAELRQEPLMSHDTERIHQQTSNSMTQTQLNQDPKDEEVDLNLIEPLSLKPQTRKEPNFALKHGTDMIAALTEEIMVQLKEPEDAGNNSRSRPADSGEANSDEKEMIICDYKTSAALCFQNSLCFDLD
ncbi:protein kintoun [Paramisgurnus dabryanus]|uniref:protein kintoun n=1 Tax=Paramisgurnus dabryanus TaxID=90735 RepID=UPI0031F341C1